MSAVSNYRIPSLETACQVIKLMAENPRGLSRDDIEKRLGIPRSNAYRILQTLRHEGFIDKGDRLYKPGEMLYQLSLRLGSVDHLRPLARPVLHSLAQVSGLTAHLAVPSGFQSLLIEVCDAQCLTRVASRTGSLVPLHASATGKVFLAHLFPDQLATIESLMGFHAFTDNTLTTVSALAEEGQRVLKQGYALDDRELSANVRCLAAPIFDASGVLIAAMGVTGATSLFTKKAVSAVAGVVRDHARRCYTLLKADGAAR